MKLDSLMFDYVRSIPFTVMVGCVRAKESVSPRVYYDVEIHVIVKGDVFYIICRGHTKN